MALTKAQKQKILEDLREKVSKQKIMIFVDFTGLEVKDLNDLRKKLKVGNNQLKVAKKTLLRIVFKEKNFQIDIKKLKGQLGVVFGFGDEILVAKTIYQFSLENPKLKILGGFFEGDFINLEKVIELAKLSSKEELLARLIGSFQSPISNFINILQANIKGLLYVLAHAKT